MVRREGVPITVEGDITHNPPAAPENIAIALQSRLSDFKHPPKAWKYA
jgi:hypothetical protein